MVELKGMELNIWIINDKILPLQQFFIHTYQERQRDLGPVKPWQPMKPVYRNHEGAKSDHIQCGKISASYTFLGCYSYPLHSPLFLLLILE